jgi:hypothetical protein
LLHGQPFNLEYEIDGCSRVLIIYDNGGSIFKKFVIKKNNGIFSSITNAYAPKIRFIALTSGFKHVDFDLRINFMNVKPVDMTIQLPKPTSIEIPEIKTQNYTVKTPVFPESKISRIGLLNNKIIIKPYDDLSEYLNQN